jgi:glucose-6-phosphate 1-epimerase
VRCGQAKKLADFGDDEYHHMLCIEPGVVKEFVPLAPGESLTLAQTITPL